MKFKDYYASLGLERGAAPGFVGIECEIHARRHARELCRLLLGHRSAHHGD